MTESNTKIEPLYAFYSEFSIFYDEQLKKAWNKIDIVSLNNMATTFTDKMRSFKHKGLIIYSQYLELDKIKDSFVNNVNEVVTPLKNPIIDERIMNSFMKDLKKQITVNFNGTSLNDILKLNLLAEKDKIATLVDDARQENEIKAKYLDCEAKLSKMQFKYKSYKRGNEDKGFIFKDVSEEGTNSVKALANFSLSSAIIQLPNDHTVQKTKTCSIILFSGEKFFFGIIVSIKLHNC